jgi:glycosyltransferase involved in cell wall biosynthesis
MRFYSVIIPVYNRPEEVDELLDSLTKQSLSNFEVIIVEDGSENRCQSVAAKYEKKLKLSYYYKENTGQGFSRNYGFERAKGDYLIVFDSDCIIPSDYLEHVESALEEENWDAYGGPDKADESFTAIQKAINYSMTSIFTTGGIRGKKKHAGTYHPRSFNMGISRKVFEKTKGYQITRKGEDIDLSIRILNDGFKIGLIEEAFVYHKRRTSIKQFYRQLNFFGKARINIKRMHPRELKIVHLFPLAFLLGLLLTAITWPLLPFFSTLMASFYALYYVMILVDSSIKNKSLFVGLVSLITTTVQLSAYAIGMITEVLKPDPSSD